MRPWMCLSLPNSGSDWFAELVAQCTPGARYYRKEFFNPVTNWEHLGTLAEVFGCELPSTAGNLYRQMNHMVDDEDIALMLSVIDSTWGQQDRWNCNKEVWSFANAAVFQQRFQLWGLSRSAATLFPPSRARVWAWYDAIACAAAIEATPFREFEQRCRMAHGIATGMLQENANRIGFPILDYDRLITGDAFVVMGEIEKLCVTKSVVDGLDMERLLRRVLLERRQKKTQTDQVK